MLRLTMSLNVILTSCKVPHKISPIHEVKLIAEEEPEVVSHARNLYCFRVVLPRNIIFNRMLMSLAKPFLVLLRMSATMYSREEHTLV